MPGPLDGVRRAIHDARDKIHGAGDDIRTLAEDMGGMARGFREEAGIEEAPQPQPQRSRLTNDETIAYQNREIAKELWALEKHLSQGCRIRNAQGELIPCDCCEKGTFIAGLAQEAIPIAERGGRQSAVYEEISHWCEELDPVVTVAAVESGQYDYKRLSGQCSALRKKLMGSTSLESMLPPGSVEYEVK